MLGNPRVLELAGKVWKLKRNAATSWKIRKQQLRIKELRILQVYKDEGRKTLFIRTNSAEERTTTILKHYIPSLKPQTNIYSTMNKVVLSFLHFTVIDI